MNENMSDDIKKQRNFINNTARSLEGKGIHFMLTVASQDARTVQYDQRQFDKVCVRIRILLEDDIKNGYKKAETKLAEFDRDPKTWLKLNFHPLTWRSEAEPDWNKWITP
jgi:hypothetical protein